MALKLAGSYMISYRDIRFNEVAEVRWAIFLDALRIEYLYRSPYFFLPPADGAYIGARGNNTDKNARRVAKEKCAETRKPVYLFSGDPWFNDAVEFFVCTDPLAGEPIGTSEGHGWCQCPVCGIFDIGCERNPFSPFMVNHPECPGLLDYANARDLDVMQLAPAVDVDWTVVSPSIAMAFCAAKSDFQDASFPAIFESIRDAIDLLKEARVFASRHAQAQWDAACNRATRTRALDRAKVIRMQPKNTPGGDAQ
jgi:hypothetical protein